MTEKEAEDKVIVSASPLSPHDKALLKFGKDFIVGSVDTIRDFAKTMITLVSGLFAVYFALLQFLGAANVTKIGSKAVIGIVYLPPMFFILSIVAFVLGVLPIAHTISLNQPDTIRKARSTILRVKYVAVLVGLFFFLLGMYYMSKIGLMLLFG